MSSAGKIDDGIVPADKPHLLDCQNLSAMDLRKKYPSEATSHRHMLEREEKLDRTIHPRFRKFRDFLADVGPKPFPKATLDRIDNDDPEYAPGKVRWADKRTQTNNRMNTLLFQSDGRQFLSSELAKLQKVSPSTIRQRRQRGWSDQCIIAGKQLPQTPVSSVVEPIKARAPESVPSASLEVIWLQAMDAAYPGQWSALAPREKKMLRDLATHCCEGGLAYRVEEVLDHTIKHWMSFTKCAENDHGAFNTPSKPTIDFLYKHIRVAVNLWLFENSPGNQRRRPPAEGPSGVGTREEALPS